MLAVTAWRPTVVTAYDPSDSSKLKITMFVRIRLRSDLKITLCKSEWCTFDQMLVKQLLRNRKNCRRSEEVCFSLTWKSWMLPKHSALGWLEKYANPASHFSWFLSTPDYLLIWKQVSWNICDPLVLVGDIGTGEFTRPIWGLIPNPSLRTVTLFLLPKGCPKIFRKYFWDTSVFPSYLILVDYNSLNCPIAINFECVVWFHPLYVPDSILHISNAILLIATVGLVLLPEMHSCWMSWMQSRKGGSRMCPETKSKCAAATCAYLMKQHKYTKCDAQILGFRVEIHKYINTFCFLPV